MTAEEKDIALSLGNCVYLPGSLDKKFAGFIASVVRNSPEKVLTEKQRAWMYSMLRKYRRQIPETYKKYCIDIINKPLL